MYDEDFGEFESYVKTTRTIPYEVEELTGILSFRKQNSQLRNAPSFTEVMDKFIQWIASFQKNHEVIMVGHNIRSFDFRILFRQSKRHSYPLQKKFENALPSSG